MPELTLTSTPTPSTCVQDPISGARLHLQETLIVDEDVAQRLLSLQKQGFVFAVANGNISEAVASKPVDSVEAQAPAEVVASTDTEAPEVKVEPEVASEVEAAAVAETGIVHLAPVVSE